MKIAFIHPSWPGSEGTGATHSATKTVTELRDRGHELTVYCPVHPPIQNDDIEDIELRTLESSWLPQGNLRLNRAIKKQIHEFDSFDIVHSYLMTAIPAMEAIGKQHDVATVVTLNAYGGVCPKNDLLYRGIENCTNKSPAKCSHCILTTSLGRNEGRLRRAASLFANDYLVRKGERNIDKIDAFRAPSGHVKENYITFGFPERKLHVIPHMLDEQFSIPHESDFQSPYQLLYVGALENHKGVDRLVPTLKALRENEQASYELTVVGDGSMRAELKREVESEELDDVVTIRGFVPNGELPTVYANHDIFLYPGRWDEPLARVYLEALATGTPIVSTEYGTIKSVIGSGGTTAEGSPEDLARTVEELVDSGLKEYSRGAHDRAERYRAKNVIGEIEGLYQSLLRG
ncbi:glycosyltransferase family 4 protein [Halostella sp. JP-L12]|uniref:glycosyltransferase family 4 protein n=1 Tax=Halostella TaxID=1843185 RepID=UPI000EF7B0BE|nr:MULTISPECIES: glycosyltransferase family 4 protein [Halostella]NHN46221.1 glycosyltransferase family 4 protein [Halostella sp. JP-L12]